MRRVEMHHEEGFLGRRRAFDPPLPDLFLEIVEDDLRARGAEQAAHIVLGHAVANAAVVGVVEDLFNLADDFLAVEADHVALGAARLAAVFPGGRAVIVPVREAGFAHTAADFRGRRLTGLDLLQVDRIAGRQQHGGDGGAERANPGGQFHRKLIKRGREWPTLALRGPTKCKNFSGFLS